MPFITSNKEADWWRHAIVYQIYPRSFCDANGDGIGDLKGITSKIGYLQELGIDAVWLCPFYPSALKDGGYDVSDYRDVDPKIGTLDDFDEMIREMDKAGIKCLVDIVPNHCSEDHPWFQEALKAPKGSVERERFVFRDGVGEGKSRPPNDWKSVFDGSAWDPVGDGQFYFHLFDSSQPDFNWHVREVRDDFLKTLRFWGDRGVSGFRVDVAMGVCKDFSEPYAPYEELLALRQKLLDPGNLDKHPFWDRDEVFDVYKEWRGVFQEYDPPLTGVAEAFVARDRQHLYADDAGLGQCFTFDILTCPYNSKNIKNVISNSLHDVKGGRATSTWVLSNHDVVRHASRYGLKDSTVYSEGVASQEDIIKWQNDYLISGGIHCNLKLGLRRARAMTLLILALPGSTYMYQGEELGLSEVVDIPDDERQCPVFKRTKGTSAPETGRDGCRVPIPWTREGKSFGFSPESASSAPHLPMPKWFADHAADQGGKDGIMTLYKKALSARRRMVDEEEIEFLDTQAGTVRFRRGAYDVLINVDAEDSVRIPQGDVLVASGEINDFLPVDTTVWLKST